MPEYLYSMPNIASVSANSHENSIATCGTGAINASIVCDDYEGCGNMTLDTTSGTNNNGAVCCNAAFGCFDANGATTQNGDIRCDGTDACHPRTGSIATNGINTGGGGDIHITGFNYDHYPEIIAIEG